MLLLLGLLVAGGLAATLTPRPQVAKADESQLALLQEEQELYEASLDKALELLNGYYATEREETQSVIARLQELKQVQVKPELPDISASQQALASFIENRFESRRQGGGDA